MATAKKKSNESKREAILQEQAASRGYTLEKEGGVWYAEIAGTRFGPLRTLEELAEFLPAEQ